MDFTSLGFRGCFVISLALIYCLTPALLLFFLGYQIRQEWNDQAEQTRCLVKDHKIYQDGTCYSWWTKKYYTCFDGYAVLSHTFQGVEYNAEVYIGTEDDEKAIHDDLNKDYVISEDVDCWFKADNPSDIIVKLKDSGIFLGFSILFMVLLVIVIVVWAVLEYVDYKDQKERSQRNEGGLGRRKYWSSIFRNVERIEAAKKAQEDQNARDVERDLGNTERNVEEV